MSDTATAAAETTIAPAVTDTTSPPDPAPQATPANGQTPGTPESNAQEGSGAGDPAATPQGQQGEEQKEKPRTRFQDRIDELTAKSRGLEREKRDLLAEVTRLREQNSPPPPHASLEEQDEYRLRKVVREERADQLEQQARRLADVEVQTTYEKFATKAQAVADRIPDLLERFSDPALPVSKLMGEFVADSEKGAEIAHFLAENPSESARIKNLSDAQQGIALARLEARLGVAPPIRKVSTAPNPPPTVTGNNSSASRDPEEMSPGEYIAWFKKREAAKKRG
jgi:hypothetical protein